MKFFYENKGWSISARYGAGLAFGAHLHSHIELVYMIEGRVKALVDSRECIVSTGDAFIVFPNQIHQYQKIDNEYYLIIIFPPDICPEFQGIFKNKVPMSPVIRNASANSKIFSFIKDITEVNNEKPPFYDTLIKGYFLVLLSELFQMMSFEEASSSDVNTIKTILNYCSENYTKDIRLETLSQELHISKYHVCRLFTQKLHMGFNEYIGMLRISEACRLLVTQDKSITEVAYGVGFNSTRSFNRLFSKYAGMTPRQYRKTRGTVLDKRSTV